MKARILVICLLIMGGAVGLYAWTSLAVDQDPLVRMPGTQPGQVTLESPGRCLNCHAGYNPSVEPGYSWKGSMMAQSARDFLFWACMTVAAQDSIWAINRPNATDICERCHFPKGWLEGRSDPTNASLMTAADFDGVQCDFCHTMFDAFFETTFAGTRKGGGSPAYWDETNLSGTPSQPAAAATYAEDMAQAQNIVCFDGSGFYGVDNLPFSAEYSENASGQYFMSAGSQKRASFADAAARHQMFYSRYHKSKYFCSTCHDVSNPILANLGLSGLPDLSGGANLITEQYSAARYFHVERTFSEFMLSDYGQGSGAAGIGPFAPQLYDTSNVDNRINKCQDCHMRDVVGRACNKQGVPIRPNDSIEHPLSGQPLHDLTGGNVWVSYVLASAIPGSANYDVQNDVLLNQGAAVLTLDLAQGEGIDPQALLAGVDRARQQLLLAASIENLNYDPATGALSFRVQNQTGHKLISGFPEGRRMFVNIKAYAGGSLLYEVNPYDEAAGTLKGLNYPYQPDAVVPPPAALNVDTEAYVDELVYEMHPSSTLTGENETFHFALATDRYKDNRIPPKGFRIDEAAGRIAQPRWHGADAPGYFSADEYAGGHDEVAVNIVPGADYVEVDLYYQTTSREYIEFLRDEIQGTGNLTLPTTPGVPGPGDPQHYIIQTDPFFAQLKGWGDTIWQLWVHNMDLAGAAPFLMTQATAGAPPTPCTPPVPVLLSAAPGNTEATIIWSDEHSADPLVAGYGIYYDQAGKAQWVAEVGLTTSYLDTGLTNGQEYCYKVTALYAACESGFSNILCAIPNNQGQARVGARRLETGLYSGKGKKKTFTVIDAFKAGDAVVIRAHVADGSTGLPVANATVDISITGPQALTLTAGPSDNAGAAEVTWQTQKPNKRGQGGTPAGSYTATVTNVTATGYTWDGATTSTVFVIQ